MVLKLVVLDNDDDEEVKTIAKAMKLIKELAHFLRHAKLLSEFGASFESCFSQTFASKLRNFDTK